MIDDDGSPTAPDPIPDPMQPAGGAPTVHGAGRQAPGSGAGPTKVPANPFLVPEMQLNPLQPLVPWKVPEHDEYYVSVDHTHTAYEEFKAAVDHDARTLHDHGRLVAVLGGTGCGKTSLLNRCVGWMKAELTTLGVKPFVLECNQPVDIGAPLELGERMNAVCRRVVTRAKRVLSLDPTYVDALRDNESRPADLYDSLSEILEASSHSVDAVLIILLPPTDLRDEVVKYAQMVHPRLIFCLESTAVGRPIPWPARMLAGTVAPPIELRVSPLGPDDASLFTNERLARHHGGIETPTVGEDVMSELSGSPAAATLAGLVGLMYGIYAHKLSRPPPYTAVTVQDVARYLLAAYAKWTSP